MSKARLSPLFQLPNVAGVLRHHGLARLASPGLLELRHVLHHAIHAVLARRMRIGEYPGACNLFALFLAPYAAKPQEESLLGRVAVDFLAFSSRLVIGDHVLKRH